MHFLLYHLNLTTCIKSYKNLVTYKHTGTRTILVKKHLVFKREAATRTGISEAYA